MRILLASIITLLTSDLLFAQLWDERKDILIWKNDTFELCSSPLECFSSFREKVFSVDSCFVEDCERLYYAEWQLLDDTLFLHNVFSCCDERNINEIAGEFFKTNLIRNRLIAYWVEGTFKVNRDYHYESLERFVNQSFHYLLAKQEVDLIFSAGIMVDYISHRECKSVYSESNSKLQDLIYSNVNWNNLPYLNEDPLKIPVSFFTDKEGNISNVWVDGLRESIYTLEAIRLVKLIPKWDLYYDCGLVYIPRVIVIEFSTTMKKKYAR